MKVYEQPYLTFQSNSHSVIEHIKDYSPTAKYALTNILGISSNIMNMTIATETVATFADFLTAGIVTITYSEEGFPAKSQKHAGYELYFVMNGILPVEIEQTAYQLQKYDAVIMNQNCKSMIGRGENLILITITLSKEYLEKNKLLKNLNVLSYKSRYDNDYKDAEYVILHAKDVPKGMVQSQEAGALSVDCKEDIEKLLYQFHKELSKKMIGYEQIVSGLLMRIFYSLTNENLYEIEKIQEKSMDGEDVAENIKAYLDENPRKVTMEELADRFHYNRNYLTKVFYENMNQTIKAYNHQVCMREAKRLLTETSLPVTLIAERLGFMSRSQFYKVFKEYFGCTPNREVLFNETTNG